MPQSNAAQRRVMELAPALSSLGSLIHVLEAGE